MDVKQTLMQFVSNIDEELLKFWDSEKKKEFGFNEKQKKLVHKIITHSAEHNLRPAKRLRGSFTYYAYKLTDDFDEKNAWIASMAVELVHTALLMHDDVMDSDDVRRGKPTTHKYFEQGDVHYGESMAYTIGDAVLCLGFELLTTCKTDSKRIIKATQKILRGINETAYGQAYDVTLEKLKKEWKESDVIALHGAKTAIYTYENPLFIGAILAGITDKKIFSILNRYSMSGGVAFQLQDDILGVYGDPEKTGKSANSDLLQGKCTLLVLKTFERGTKSQIKALENVWGKRKASKSDIEVAKKAIQDSGALDYSREMAKKYAQKAARIAEELRKFPLHKEAIDYIQGIAEYMVKREV